jgi:hypothetical protein
LNTFHAEVVYLPLNVPVRSAGFFVGLGALVHELPSFVVRGAWFAALDEEAINSPEPIQRRMSLAGASFGAQICAFWHVNQSGKCPKCPQNMREQLSKKERCATQATS